MNTAEINQDGWVGGHGTHTSTCGTIITENKLETVRKTPIQPRL